LPKLITIRGPTRGREFELEDVCLLGRSPNCQVYIGDLTVSREHARLSDTAEGWVVEDLGSSNGTYVNETRITRHVLQRGDEIRISGCVLRFTAPQEDETKPRWVNMVTVMAGADPGLVHTVTQARLPVPPLREVQTQAELRDDLTRAHRMLETLYAVSNAVASILDPKQLFEQILDYLFQVFPDAERGFVMTLDANSQLVPAAIRRRRDESRLFDGGLAISQSVVADVLQQGRSVLTTSNRQRESSGCAKMCAPLAAQGKTYGILLIEGRRDARPFSPEDLDLLTGIAAQAGVAFLNAHMHQLLLRQQRLEQDMLIARQIQQSFMPSEPPEVPGYRFTRRYNPVFEVGGDFYDFIPLPEGCIGILIGDVSGKGVSAALLMARLTSDMRTFAISERSPARVLQRANVALCSSSRDNMFATVLYAVLDVPRNVLSLCNAGHLPPLVRESLTGEVTVVDEATNLALGVLPEATFDQHILELRAGDSVVLCTDGVIEAKNSIAEEYGFARLKRVVAGALSDGALDAVLKDLQRHTGATGSQYDDITMVEFIRLTV
jgi:phosphoserine phosphatase RsbU/P